jgi:hypothetical protein
LIVRELFRVAVIIDDVTRRSKPSALRAPDAVATAVV